MLPFPFADLTRCNVWILDGDLYHKGLLKFAVSAQSLPDCLAVFVADMSRPWTIMESLKKWAGVLRDHVDKLKISPEDMREMEQKSKSFSTSIFPYVTCIVCGIKMKRHGSFYLKNVQQFVAVFFSWF